VSSILRDAAWADLERAHFGEKPIFEPFAELASTRGATDASTEAELRRVYDETIPECLGLLR